MLSELFLFVILINLSSKSNVAYSVPQDDDIQWELTRVQRENSLFDSFNDLLNRIKSFFGIKTKAIAEKRQRMKSALNLFLDELNKKVPIKKKHPVKWNLPIHNNKSNVSRTDFHIKPEMNAEQIIAGHGFRSESHTVLTDDGFMLTLQRVLPQKMLDSVSKRVVLLHHGILGSSEDWLLLGPERALPYILINYGYDVWLLNARGNKYSKIHTTKHIDRQDFWDFSFHEIGMLDLPAIIKFINEITKPVEINYVGHSLGSTALLVLLSTLPEYNYNLKSGIFLAPLAFMYHAKGPIRVLADFSIRNGYNSLNFLGQTEFLPDRLFPLQIIEKFCKAEEETLCLNPLLLLANGGNEMLNEQVIENILSRVPAGGSAKTIIHYVQLVKTGFFQMFDYGALNNLRKYDSSSPPLYDLKLVTLPIAVFSSPSDWLATESDIQTLLPLLQDVNVHHVVKAENFGHLDFVWSQDAPELVFDFIVPILDKMRPKKDFFIR